MSSNIRTTTLRFNLENERDCRAWNYLQTMDRKQYHSYSQAAITAILDHFGQIYDPSDRTEPGYEELIQSITESVERTIERTLPPFLAGYLAGVSISGSAAMPMDTAGQEEKPAAEEDPADEDIDWDILNGS